MADNRKQKPRRSSRTRGRKNGILIAAGAVGLTLLCTVALNLRTTQAYFASTASQTVKIDSKYFNLQVVDIDDNPVTRARTLSLQEEGTPYVYSLEAPGTATGYCKVTTEYEGKTEEQYIYPIEPNSITYLYVYAASGTQISFAYGWGNPDTNGEGAVVVEPTSVRTVSQPASSMSLTAAAAEETTQATEPVAATASWSLMSRNRARAVAVETEPEPEPVVTHIKELTLNISETPYVICNIPEGARLESIAGYYRVTVEDILTFNGIKSIEGLTTIKIPNTTVTENYQIPGTYTLQEGDTLQAVADKMGVTLDQLCMWNSIAKEDMDRVGVGLMLEVPVVYVEPEIDVYATEPEETTEETVPETTVPEETTEGTTPETTEPDIVKDEEGNIVSVQGIPLYFQGDYPDAPYADGTVKTSGCSVTSLTMVANAITGYDYAVDELAEYFGGSAENNNARLENGSTKLGLQYVKTKDWHETWAALQEGKIVIALMSGLDNQECLFTDSQHYIVLCGLTEEGKILVNDSNEGNYSSAQLKDGFENGFDIWQLQQGYQGSWAYDRTLEQQPDRYSEVRTSQNYLSEQLENTEVEFVVRENYPGVELTDEERELLAKLIWAEARGEIAAGQQAVAEVVLNRLVSGAYQNTIQNIIYAKDQFEGVPQMEEAEPTQAQYQAIDRALHGTPILPKTVYYYGRMPRTNNKYMIIDHHVFCFAVDEG